MVVVAGMSNGTLNVPSGAAVKVVTGTPLIERLPVWPAANPALSSAICVPGMARVGAASVGWRDGGDDG